MTSPSPWQRRLRHFVGLPAGREHWPAGLQQLPRQPEANSLTVPFSLPLLARAQQLRTGGHRVLIGLNGPVGAGKSTLVRQLQLLAPCFDLTLAVASIDDVYRPLNERRAVLAGNPFGVSRVPPGSHDLPLLLEALDQWRHRGTLTLPRFDKTLAGGEGERNGWSVQRAEVVLLEGWLTGCRALGAALKDPGSDGGIPLTEGERAWLPRWDKALGPYARVWDQLDALWVLRPTDWSWPRRWRFQAEARQRRAGGDWLAARELDALVRSSLASLPPTLYQDPLVTPNLAPLAAKPGAATDLPPAGTINVPPEGQISGQISTRSHGPIRAEAVALIDSRRRCRWSGLTQDLPNWPLTTVQLSSASASSATG